MCISDLHNISIDELFGRDSTLERKLECIKVALADLSDEKQQEV
ncbi:TPA: DNA-binding protein, partial [Bacillus anthracis]|nr:DNA-binding protein [Bacillus anthracis]